MKNIQGDLAKNVILGMTELLCTDEEEFATLSESELKLLNEQIALANAYVQMIRNTLAITAARVENLLTVAAEQDTF